MIIVGGDPFYRKKIREELLSSLPNLRSEVYLSSPSSEDLARECFSNSLFNTFKLVRVDGFSYKKDMETFFDRFLSIENAPSFLIIEEPDVEKALSLEKKFKPGSKFKILSLQEMKPKEKAKFVQKHSSECGLTIIDLEAAETLLNLCDGNLSIVHEEIAKLKLLFGNAVTGRQIIEVVTPISNQKDAIQFYVSLMTGDSVNSVSIARQISFDEGYEIILGCLVRISYLVLLLHHVNGNDKTLSDFLKKKRTSMSLKWSLGDAEDVSKSGPPPSPFVMRVAKKLYDRVDSRSFWSKLFTQCYDSYLEYRLTANENKASADMEKVICVISRR